MPFDPLKFSVVSLQKRYNPTLNLRDFHRTRIGFTAAASASAHVCLLTCCNEASRSIRAEKDGTSGITLLSFPAAYAVLTGDNIYHEAFFFHFPHNGPHVCLSAELIAALQRISIISGKRTTCDVIENPPAKLKLNLNRILALGKY